MDPESQRTYEAVEHAAEAVAPTVQRELERAYGPGWLEKVNAERAADGYGARSGLHDARFVMALVGYEPALETAFDQRERRAAKRLNGIGNAAIHDPPLADGTAREAQELAACLRVRRRTAATIHHPGAWAPPESGGPEPAQVSPRGEARLHQPLSPTGAAWKPAPPLVFDATIPKGALATPRPSRSTPQRSRSFPPSAPTADVAPPRSELLDAAEQARFARRAEDRRRWRLRASEASGQSPPAVQRGSRALEYFAMVEATASPTARRTAALAPACTSSGQAGVRHLAPPAGAPAAGNAEAA